MSDVTTEDVVDWMSDVTTEEVVVALQSVDWTFEYVASTDTGVVTLPNESDKNQQEQAGKILSRFTVSYKTNKLYHDMAEKLLIWL
jgi:hypothetical protein